MESNSIYSEDSKYWYSERFWGWDWKIQLPRSLKTYFDFACHEYGDIGRHEKFLELGWCLWNGLDLYGKIKPWVDAHDDYERDVITAIAHYIEELRSGDTHQERFSYLLITTPVIGGKPMRKLKLKEAVRLFSDELLLRYRPRHIVECHWDYKKIMADCKSKEEMIERFYAPTPATEIPISEEEIMNANPWMTYKNNYVEKDICSLIHKFYPNDKFLLKCDAYYINRFNEKHKGTDCEFILNQRPSTISGNPMKAKVVALSLNPGYVYEKDYLLAEKLHPSNLEEFNVHRVEELELRADSFMCRGNTEITDRDAWKNEEFVSMRSPRDIQNMLGDWYWYDILESFRKEAGLPEEGCGSDIIYDNFALLQYIGYSSKSYKALPAGVTLPSQRFTKLLIHHLAMNRKDVVFVVSRSEKLWRELIGEDVWSMLDKEKRLVIRKHFINKHGVRQTIRTQGFARGSFEGDGFERIVNAFKKCM